MTTPRDIIMMALKTVGAIGVGQSPLAEDVNDAFQLLNWLVSQWNRKRWIVWHLLDLSKVSTGAYSYTVGPGGDFDISPRPDRLEDAFARQLVNTNPNQVDYPLRVLQAREDYDKISIKHLGSFPQSIFYDTDYPTGTVFPWPVPQASIYEIHIVVKAVIAQFTNLSQTLSIPEEVEAALHWNLAARLYSRYGFPIDPGVVAFAKDAYNVLRGANTQIAALQIPSALLRPGLYNVFSDQVR